MFCSYCAFQVAFEFCIGAISAHTEPAENAYSDSKICVLSQKKNTRAQLAKYSYSAMAKTKSFSWLVKTNRARPNRKDKKNSFSLQITQVLGQKTLVLGLTCTRITQSRIDQIIRPDIPDQKQTSYVIQIIDNVIGLI